MNRGHFRTARQKVISVLIRVGQWRLTPAWRWLLITSGFLAALIGSPFPTGAAAAGEAPTFTAQARVSSAVITPGDAVTATVTVTSGAATTAMISIEGIAPTGVQIFQRTYDDQRFSAGQRRTYTVTWRAPASAPGGDYFVKLGVFVPRTGMQYLGEDRAAQFSVLARQPNASSTAAPPTASVTVAATPTAAATAMATATATPTTMRSPTVTSSPTATPAQATPLPPTATLAPTADALHARVRGELKGFTDWLAANGVKGYIGEVGWPNNTHGDAGQWNALAEAWYQDADGAGLWVTAWGTHQRVGQSNLGIYKTAVDYVPPLAVRDTQADTFERHPTTPAYLRGINVWGAIINAPYQNEPVSSFSNVNPGTYGYYGYDDQSTFDFLRARGVRVIRLGFRWERLQRLPGAPLDPVELQRLKDCVSRIRAAGLQVIIYPHNFGAYYLYDGTQGVRRTIGSAEVTQAHFVDLWARLSTEFKDDGTVIGYGLMNEPTGMGGVAWRAQSQAALDRIRANGDAKLILVPGYDYSSVHAWVSLNPVAWIRDSRDNFRYEAHHYFDRDHSGTYALPYTDEVADARARGY